MAQLELFDNQPPQRLVLLRDAEGGVIYTPGFLRREQAQDWFKTLAGGIDWQQEGRVIHEREVDVRRLVARYRLDDGSRVPQMLRKAAALVSDATGVAFNSIVLNYSRDGKDVVTTRSDRLDELEPGHPIALLSLGSARRMIIRAREPPRRALPIDLQPGSLLLMSYQSQLHYQHGIVRQREARSPWISLTFRLRPRNEEAGNDAS